MSQIDGPAGDATSEQRGPVPNRSTTMSTGVAVLALLSVLAHLYGLYRPAGPAEPAWFSGEDKVAHLLGFAVPVAAVLTARWLRDRAGQRAVSRSFVLAVVAAFSLHALVSEVLQGSFYRSRHGDPADAVADLVGVALGWAVFARIRGSACGSGPTGRPELVRP